MGKFSEGFKYFLNSIQSSVLGAEKGEAYVQAIEDEIKKLENDINAFEGFQTGTSQLKGDIFEFWSADTFNINAAVRGSDNRAFVLRSNEFGSADIITGDGIKYSLKAYKNGIEGVKAQAVTLLERFKEYQATGGSDDLITYLQKRGYSDEAIINDVVYSQQERLIPQDQIEVAVEWLKKKIAKELSTRPEQAKRYIDTLKRLTDKIFDSNGNHSDPIKTDKLNEITDKAKKGKFSSKEEGLTLDKVRGEYILKQALYAGLTAVKYSILIKLGIEFLNIIKTSEIDLERLKDKGKQIVSESPEDFLRGCVAAAITILCKTGRFGEALQNCEPTTIAFATVITFNVFKNAYSVGQGTMTRKELIDKLCRDVCAMLGARAIPAIVPAVGTIVGSFLGSVIGIIVYNTMSNKVISFCAESGFTLFGIVEQNYELPTEILEKIDFSTFKFDSFNPKDFTHKSFQVDRFNASSFKPKSIGLKFYKRGKIAHFKVGYIEG